MTPSKKLEKIIEQHEDGVKLEEAEIEVEEKIHDVEEQVTNKVSETFYSFFTTKLNIVTIGDSLTEGIGDPTNEGGYVGILNRLINDENEPMIHFHNFGKRGLRSDQLLKKIEEKDINKELKKADIIIVSIGANDVMQIFKENITQLTLTPFITEEVEYELRLRQLLTELQTINRSVQIYLLGIYNPFSQHFADIEELNIIVDNRNKIAKNVTEDFSHSSFIPIDDLFIDETNTLLAEDFFHPNYDGYYKIAERILSYIIEKGDEEND